MGSVCERGVDVIYLSEMIINSKKKRQQHLCSVPPVKVPPPPWWASQLPPQNVLKTNPRRLLVSNALWLLEENWVGNIDVSIWVSRCEAGRSNKKEGTRKSFVGDDEKEVWESISGRCLLNERFNSARKVLISACFCWSLPRCAFLKAAGIHRSQHGNVQCGSTKHYFQYSVHACNYSGLSRSHACSSAAIYIWPSI